MDKLAEDWYIHSIEAKCVNGESGAGGGQHDNAQHEKNILESTSSVEIGSMCPELNVVVVKNASEIKNRVNLLSCALFDEPIIQDDKQNTQIAQNKQSAMPYNEAKLTFREIESYEIGCGGSGGENDASSAGANGGVASATADDGGVGAKDGGASTVGNGIDVANIENDFATNDNKAQTHVTWKDSIAQTRQDTKVTENAQKTLDALAYRDLYVFQVVKSWSKIDGVVEGAVTCEEFSSSTVEEQEAQIRIYREKMQQINDRIEFLKGAKGELERLDAVIQDSKKQLENMQNVKPETLIEGGRENAPNRLLNASDKEIVAIEKSLDDLEQNEKKRREELVQATAEFENADDDYTNKKKAAKDAQKLKGAKKVRLILTIISVVVAFILTAVSVYLIITQRLVESNQTPFAITFTAAFVFNLTAIIAVFTNRSALEKKIDPDVENAQWIFKKKKRDYEIVRKAFEQNKKDTAMKLKVMGLVDAGGDIARAKEMMVKIKEKRREFIKKSGGVEDIVNIMQTELEQHIDERNSLKRKILRSPIWCVESVEGAGALQRETLDEGVKSGSDVSHETRNTGDVNTALESEINFLCERRAILNLCITLRERLADEIKSATVANDTADPATSTAVSVTTQDSREEKYEDIFAEFLQARISLLRTADFIGKNVPAVFDNFLDSLGPTSQKQVARTLRGLSRAQQVILFTCNEDVASLVRAECPACTIIPWR